MRRRYEANTGEGGLWPQRADSEVTDQPQARLVTRDVRVCHAAPNARLSKVQKSQHALQFMPLTLMDWSYSAMGCKYGQRHNTNVSLESTRLLFTMCAKSLNHVFGGNHHRMELLTTSHTCVGLGLAVPNVQLRCKAAMCLRV